MRRAVVLAAAVVASWALPASAQGPRVTSVSRAPFAQVATALERAISDHKMALVCHANAQRSADARGVSITGNQVLMVFRNDFALRLQAAEPAAGFEAPIRIYVYENADGTATVGYVPPSPIFASYANPEVKKIAAELDPIFEAIVRRTLSSR